MNYRKIQLLVILAVVALLTPRDSLAASAAADSILAIAGPVTALGTSPWPWYDIAAKANADEVPFAASLHKPVLGAAAAGTFTLSDGCHATLSGTGATEFNPGDYAIVAWNAVEGTGSGRLTFVVSSRSGNVLTSSNICGLGSVVGGSGLTVYHCGVNCALPSSDGTYVCSNWGVCPMKTLAGDSWNFYDSALAVFRMYLRTGQLKYLLSYRDIADTWWTWALDSGGTPLNPPRSMSLVSQFIRALDGHPERLPLLYSGLMYSFQNQVLTEVTGDDTREPGYMLLFAAVGARADSDPTRHAGYCSVVASHAQLWLNTQLPEGYWSEKNGTYAYAVPGTSPWRMFAVLQGMARAYDVLIDTSSAGCNNTVLAGRVLTAIEAAANFTYNYGYDPGDRGTYYDLMYPNDGQDGTNNGLKSGTVSVGASGTLVTGSGTKFLSTFACNGSDYIGIEDSTGETWTYPVASCADNTHLTLSKPWGSQVLTTDTVTTGMGTHSLSTAVNNLFYYQTPAAFTTCRNSASHCWPETGDRNNGRDLIWIQGWLYKTTHNSLYLTRGDELFSSSYGGPAGGPGATGACGGPACDGYETDYMMAIHGCKANPTLPCNDQESLTPSNAFAALSKRWAQGSGIGGADNYLSWRLRK
jgi:hypothetical protein